MTTGPPPNYGRRSQTETFQANPNNRSAQVASRPAYPPANARPPGNTNNSFAPAGARPPEKPVSEVFEPAKIIARVGNEPILAGDLLPQINQMLEPHKGKATESQLNGERQKLMRQFLEQAMEYKLLYQDFLRTLPEDRRAEVMLTAREKLFEEFDEKQLDKAMKAAKVDTPKALDAKLREVGSSLKKRKNDFMEQTLARAQLSRNVSFQPEITHDEMLERYREKSDDYAIVPAARWEQLTVRFDRFPNKAAAFQAIAGMGNEVLRGAPLSAVAKRQSQGIQAEQGGAHDWTEQGSLVSKRLDQAIFTLPPDRMSRVIEDERGFHIIRVLERREAGTVPFSEAQTEIKETLRKEHVRDGVRTYLAELKKSIRVWNIFDEEESREP